MTATAYSAERSALNNGDRDPSAHRPDRRQINWWLTALVAVLSLTVLIPLYLTVVTALKTPDQLGGTGFELPTSARWENFADAYQLTNFPQALMNTALITVGAVVLTVITLIVAF